MLGETHNNFLRRCLRDVHICLMPAARSFFDAFSKWQKSRSGHGTFAFSIPNEAGKQQRYLFLDVHETDMFSPKVGFFREKWSQKRKQSTVIEYFQRTCFFLYGLKLNLSKVSSRVDLAIPGSRPPAFLVACCFLFTVWLQCGVKCYFDCPLFLVFVLQFSTGFSLYFGACFCHSVIR